MNGDYGPSFPWQGSDDGATWTTCPGAGPLLVLRGFAYARQIDAGTAEVLRYYQERPPGAAAAPVVT